MYFFDMVDYSNSGFIGPNTVNFSICGDWENPATTRTETMYAWIKAFGEWYSSSIITKPVGTCVSAETLYNNVLYLTSGDTRITDFWQCAIDTNMLDITPEIYNNYVAAMSEQQCAVKQIFNYLDGDTFEDFTP